MLWNVLKVFCKIQSKLLLWQKLHRTVNVFQNDLNSVEISLSIFVKVSWSLWHRASNLCFKLVNDFIFKQIITFNDLFTLVVSYRRKWSILAVLYCCWYHRKKAEQYHTDTKQLNFQNRHWYDFQRGRVIWVSH